VKGKLANRVGIQYPFFSCSITGSNTTCLIVIYTNTIFIDVYIDYYTLYSSLNLLGKVD
jgi:hypothetical protein